MAAFTVRQSILSECPALQNWSVISVSKCPGVPDLLKKHSEIKQGLTNTKISGHAEKETGMLTDGQSNQKKYIESSKLH